MRGLGMQEGFALEVSFLTQAVREYEELNVRKAPKELDLRHGTDFIVRIGDLDLPVGITLQADDVKIVRDCEKATKVSKHYVAITIESFEDDQELAIDHALEALACDVAEALEKGGRVFHIHATPGSYRIEDLTSSFSRSNRNYRTAA